MMRRPVYAHVVFQKIVDHFYHEIVRRNPIAATWMGEHEYDGLLPEVGAEAVEKEIRFLRDARDAFQGLPVRELSIDERLDRQIMVHMTNLHLFHLEDVRRWRLGSDLAMNIGDAVFLLFVRDFAPLTERVESMISRLHAVPAYLMSGKTLFQDVPPLWGEIFLESARRLPSLLDTIEKSLANRISQEQHGRFSRATREALRALGHFDTWLKHAILPNAAGDWAMGASAFDAMLKVRRLGFETGELLDIGAGYLRQAQEKTNQYANRIAGGARSNHKQVHSEAIRRVKSKAPATFEQALDAYRDAVARSRAFVEMTRFATLPQNEQLDVIETPDFMSHLIPFAAYIGPERTSKRQHGVYLVTRNTRDGGLGQYNYAEISNSSVHEAYPGHHLQLTAQNQHPGKVRILADSVELIEGWAHYCEEEMKRRGFEASDDNYLIQASDEAWRAARVMLDINLHSKTWTVERGVQYLIEATNMDHQMAEAEMMRYTQTPGSQLSYLIGKHLLCELKQSLQQEFRSDLSDTLFHDLILYEGSLPIAIGKEFYPELIKDALRHGEVQGT